jgi:hypothetical protein
LRGQGDVRDPRLEQQQQQQQQQAELDHAAAARPPAAGPAQSAGAARRSEGRRRSVLACSKRHRARPARQGRERRCRHGNPRWRSARSRLCRAVAGLALRRVSSERARWH